MKFKSVLVLVMLFLITIIFIQNTEVINFRIFFWKINKLIILLPAILLIGFILGYVLAKVHHHKHVKEQLAKPCTENSKGRENV